MFGAVELDPLEIWAEWGKKNVRYNSASKS